MKILDNVCNETIKLYDKIEDITKKRPIVAIISAIALTIISGFISSFSSILAIGIFGFSLFFDVAIVKNFDKVCTKIQDQLIETFASSSSEAARIRGKREGEQFRDEMQRLGTRVQGFVEGFSS